MRTKTLSMLAAAVAAGAMSAQTFAVTPAKLVAIVGSPLPNSDGLNVTDLNTAYVAGNGKVGFLGTLSDSSRFIFFDDAIRFKSSEVPDPVLTGGEGTIGVGNLGEFVYSPSIQPDSRDGIWSHIGQLHRSTEPSPIPGMFNTFGSRPRMAADGTAFWMGGLTANPGSTTTQQDVFWRVTTTGGTPSYTPLMRGGDTIGADTISQTGLEFSYDISDNAQHHIVEVDFDGPTATDNAVILNGTTIVAREGTPAPGGGGNWQAFRNVGVNNAGNWIVYGDDNGPTNADDILVYNNTLVARQGQSLAGVTLGTTIDAAAINNLNQIVHIWDLTSGTDEGLFFTDTSDVAGSLLLLRVGDQLDTTGDGIADYTLTDFNASSGITYPLDFGDDGLVYVDVDLAPIGGGTALQAIISVAVPEPASVSLLACAGLGLLRRRK